MTESRISAELSVNTLTLTEERAELLEQHGIGYLVLNTRLGKRLIHCTAERGDLGLLFAQLSAGGPGVSLEPKWISRHRNDTGERVNGTTLDETEWLLVAPDTIVDPVNPDDPFTTVRPTVYRQANSWAGYAPHIDVEEP